MQNSSEHEARISQLATFNTISETEPSLSSQRLICLVAMLGLILRLTPLLHTNMSFAYYVKDSTQFVQLNNGLVKGCGFARLINGACQRPELLRTPSYPVFLSAIPNIRTLLVVQGLISSLICLALGMLVLHSWSYRAALVCVSLFAFDIPSIVLANEIMSEQLFTLFLLLAVVPPLLLISESATAKRASSIALLCGLAAGAAILTRPIGVVLTLIVAIPFLSIPSLSLRKRLKLAAIAIVIPAIAIGGWSLRNYRAGGYLGVSTVSAIGLYYYRAPGVLARVQGVSFDDAQAQLSHQLPVSYYDIYEAQNQSLALNNQMSAKAKKILLAYPKQTLLMTVQGTIYNAIAPMRSDLSSWLLIGPRENGLQTNGISVGALKTLLHKILSSPLIAALITIQMAVNLALWIGVGLALWHCLKSSAEYRIWCLYLGGVGILFLALAGGPEACARFRVPSFPLLAVVAGLGYGFRGLPRRERS
jgi:hypothetical protein